MLSTHQALYSSAIKVAVIGDVSDSPPTPSVAKTTIPKAREESVSGDVGENEVDSATARPAKATGIRIAIHDADKAAVYFANRAACFLKLASPDAAIADCTAALELKPGYVKALMRRCAGTRLVYENIYAHTV